MNRCLPLYKIKFCLFFLLLGTSLQSKSQDLDSTFNASNPYPSHPGVSEEFPGKWSGNFKGSMLTLPTGKIVSASYKSHPAFLHSSGSIPATPAGVDRIHKIVALPDGRLAALKDSAFNLSWASGFWVIYMDSTTGGVLNSTFIGIPPPYNNSSQFGSYEIKAMANSSVIVSAMLIGYDPPNYSTEERIYKINANGVIDSSFGTDGYITYFSDIVPPNHFMFGPNYQEYISLPIAVDLMDRIYVAIVNANQKKTVLRFFNTGIPDTAFNLNSQFHNIGTTDKPSSITPDFSGRVYVTGFSHSVLRLKMNGVPDSSFGVNGHMQNVMGNSAQLFESFVEADNKLVYIANLFPGLYARKLNEDGSFFNWTINNYWHTCWTNHVAYAEPLAACIQTDGKILVHYIKGPSVWCGDDDTSVVARFKNTPCNNGNTPASAPSPSINSNPLCHVNSAIHLAGQLNNASYWTYYTNADATPKIFYGNELPIAPTQTTTYYFKGIGKCVTDGPIDSITIEVAYSPFTVLYESITVGEAYNFNGLSINTAGTYNDTLVNSNGCDSVVTLNLSVLPKFDILVYPNPASESLTIQVTNKLSCNAAFILYDAIGNRIISENLDNKEKVTIRTNQFETGEYYYVIICDGKRIEKGKLVFRP